MPQSKINPVRITRWDWEEIYYALCSKVEDMRKGRYDDDDGPGFSPMWTDWLERIMDAIGPDGSEAAARGVAPCDMTPPDLTESGDREWRSFERGSGYYH